MDAETLREEIKKARAERDKLTEYIGALELALAIKTGAAKPLTSTGKHRSVSQMNVNSTGLSATTRRAATRASRPHEGLKILYEHDRDQTAIARELGETRSRVVSWFAAPDSGSNRPIPRKHVNYLRDKYGVPESVWARIQD